jgi:hypothetical protein
VWPLAVARRRVVLVVAIFLVVCMSVIADAVVMMLF